MAHYNFRPPAPDNEFEKITWNMKMHVASEIITKSFCTFIYRRPVTVMVVTGFLSIVLTALGINFSSLPDFSDQAKGFETRHTELSKRVVTWGQLDKHLSIYSDISEPFFRQLHPTQDAMRRRRKRDTGPFGPRHPNGGGDKSAFESFFTGGFDSSPCLQLSFDDDVGEDGNFAQNAFYFSQVVFESPSLESLFSFDALKELCTYQEDANQRFDTIRPAIDYPYFWSLPNYVACKEGLFACNELTQANADRIAKLVRECSVYRDDIIACNLPSDNLRSWRREVGNCTRIPDDCNSKFFFGLYYYAVSKNVGKDTGPVYTNVIMPALTWEAYQYRDTPNVTAENILDIYYEISEMSQELTNVKFKGMNMGTKAVSFVETFLRDSFFVMGALIAVYLIIWIYSGSLFFTVSVFLSVVFSVGVSYFVYRLVFRLRFFPFMNLLMVVLLIGIGADDTFVLKHIFSTSTRKSRTILINGIPTTIPSYFNKEDMRDALSHAALSMFVSSATTAAAFYSNLVSDIVVIKCFGVFAGTTMLINYLLVVTWLPASLIVLDQYFNPCCERICPEAITRRGRKLWETAALLPNYFLLTALPRAVMMLRYLWIGLFGAIFVASCVVVFYKPGVALPKRNPLQMFKPSDPQEWYDDYANEKFTFIEDWWKQPLDVVIVFGVQAIDDNPILEPDDYERPPNQPKVFQVDPKFKLDLAFLDEVNRVCHKLNEAEFTLNAVSCFPEKFLAWSSRQDCSQKKNDSGNPCCNYELHGFQESRDLVHCLAESSRTLDVMSGGPIFRMSDLTKADGYVLYYTANYTWSPDHNVLKTFFTDVDGGVRKILQQSILESIQSGWLVTTTVQALLWYDLQASLLHGTTIGVLISVGVALVVAAVTMRAFVLSILSVITVFAINVVTIASLILLGWNLNIVESILIVLTVGLAFDFTLNYAVAYQLSPKGTRQEKVLTVLQYMGMPVFLAFITTLVAGLVMLPSTIMAYYQIGVFMVLVALISWLYSALFFLSLLAVFGPEDCEWTLLRNLAAKRMLRRGESEATSASVGTTPAGIEMTSKVNGVQQNGESHGGAGENGNVVEVAK